MTVEEYIERYYTVKNFETTEHKVVEWNDHLNTLYEYFIEYFGAIIQDGIDNELTFQEISINMIKESIKKGYGFTEVIMVHARLNPWS